MFQLELEAPQNIAPTLKAIKKLEPEMISALKKELKSELSGVMASIQSSVPNITTNLTGFAHQGRTKFTTPVKVGISLTPANKVKGKDYHALVSFSISGAWFKIVELAGSRKKYGQWKSRTPSYKNRWGGTQSHAITSQGRIMTEKLEAAYPWSGKAGRFAYKDYIRLQPEVAGSALKILEKYVADFNRKWGI